jgi:hypothetical protein
MRMSKLMLVPLALGLIAGCGDDTIGPGDLTLADLQGTWTVTKFEYTSDTDNDVTYDAITEDDGFAAVAVVDANGQYTITTDPKSPALPSRTETGTFAVNSNGVVDTRSGGPAVNARIEVTGNQLVYTTEEASFDFPEDEVDGDVNADFRMEWQRQ